MMRTEVPGRAAAMGAAGAVGVGATEAAGVVTGRAATRSSGAC